MKMTKRIFTLALAAGMALSLTACRTDGLSTDDALKCVQVEMDTTYKGDFKGFVEFYSNVDTDDAKEQYDEKLYEQIYAKSDYTVASASKQDDGTFSVKVNIKPINILTLVMDNMESHFADFTAKYDALDLDSMSDEEFLNWYRTVYAPDYYDTLLDLLEAQIPNIGYEDERSIVIQVQQSEDGSLYISTDDLRNLDNLIMDYSGGSEN